MRPTVDPRRPVVIAGGGLCGLATAYYLRRPWVLFEREDRPGGLARSTVRSGHTFDVTGHWLHLGDPGMRAWADRLLGRALRSVERRSVIFSHGVTTRYPFQVNLHGLPPEVAYECLRGYLDRPARRRVRTFEDFVLRHFGAGIARHFMVPYNERLWGVHPREITADWCRRFVPVPDRDAVLRGALGADAPELGYNARFAYPRQGGIERLVRAIVAELPADRIACRAGVEAVDAAARRVRVGGEWIGYSALVSTLPLPELCRRLVAPPRAVVAAAERLRSTAVRYLNVALRRPAGVPHHWMYVPEAEWPAYRVGVFTNAAPRMGPDGAGSLYVELASRGREPASALARQIVPLLVQTGVVTGAPDLKFVDLHEIPIAYVVFDQHHARARRTIVEWLERRAIYPRGRFGAWDYGSMEDAMIQGRQVAKHLGSRYKSPPDATASA